jgi:hypothetical protein
MLAQTDFLEILHLIVTYGFSSIGLIIMIILAVIKWKESRNNPYNIVLILFFLSFIFGLLATVIYGVIVNSNREVAYFFARLSAMILTLGPTLLLFFLLAIERSFQGMSRNFKLTYFAVCILTASPILFIGQVYLSEHFVLSWDYSLAIYVFAYAIIDSYLILRLSAKLLKKFEKEEIKQRFRYFIFGYFVIILLLVSIIGVKLNWFTPIISSLLTGFGLIFAPLLIYYGIGKHQ